MNKDLSKRVQYKICGKMLLGEAYERCLPKVIHKD